MRTRFFFYARALIAHACLLGPLVFYPQLKQLESLGFPYSLFFFAAGALMFGALVFFVFFNVDHLFFSYSMHQYRHGHFDPNKALSSPAFILWKLFVWAFTLTFPIVFFVGARQVAGPVTMYVALLALGFFLVNMEFLFASYSTYREKRSVGRWGIGALRSKLGHD